MSPFPAIVKAKFRMARHAIGSIRRESRLKVGVVSFSAVALWLGAFGCFVEGFLYLQKNFDMASGVGILSIADILMARLLAIFALVLFFMLMFSNVLVAFAALYRSEEVGYLLHTPLSSRTLFLARFFECVVFSSWASAYLGSPLILAYGLTSGAPWPFYLAAALFYVPFVALPAAIGSIIAVIIVRLFPLLRGKALLAAGLLAVAAVFWYLRSAFSAERLAGENLITYLIDATRQTQSPLLPSYWASHGVLASAEGRYAESAFQFLLLLSHALLFVWLAVLAAQRFFYTGWSDLTASNGTRERRIGRGILGRLDLLLSGLKDPARSLVVKDVKLFWRDPAQWGQFVVFFGIMAVYVANLRNRAAGYAEQEHYRSWIACLNIGACSLILATLTSRFVFPLISLEGRRFWVLGLAPVTMRQIVRQKFWLSVATTSPFTLGLVILSCIMLRVDAIRFLLSVYSIAAANLTLAGLAVGLGSLYPNFHEDNPARIVSSMGGTLNLVLSVGYIALVVGAQTVVLQWDVLGKFAGPGLFRWVLAAVVLFVTALSIAGARLPLWLGLKHLTNAEF